MTEQPQERLAPSEQSSEEVQSSKLAELSQAMVKLYKEQFGRGPVKAAGPWSFFPIAPRGRVSPRATS